MRYLIDGYNLIFYYNQETELQELREDLISMIAAWAETCNMNIVLIFDATHSPELEQRSHLGPLEIVYTAQHETADEYILSLLKRSSHPQKKTVVTSDQRLAWAARDLKAKTTDIPSFIQKMKRRYQKKSLSKPNHIQSSSQKESEKYFDYYLRIFQEKLNDN